MSGKIVCKLYVTLSGKIDLKNGADNMIDLTFSSL